MLIDGIHVPLTEPFYRDGALYLRKLEHNVRRYSLSPVSGLVALPPGGEASALSTSEAVEVLQAVGATASREKVLIAGIGVDSVHSALALASIAEEAGFDALLVQAPSNWRTLHPSSLSLHFRAVADGTSLPVFLWSDDANGSFALPVEMVAELSAHRNIWGIYDANLTTQRYAALAEATASFRREVEATTTFTPVTRRMKAEDTKGSATFVSADALGGGGAAVAVAPPKPALKTRTKTVGFQIMVAGRIHGLVELLQAGVAGAMPRLAASAPQASYEVYAAFKDGDPALAAEKAARVEAADVLVKELGPAGIKYGCDLNGYFGGIPRLPRLALQSDGRDRVDTAFRELKS